MAEVDTVIIDNLEVPVEGGPRKTVVNTTNPFSDSNWSDNAPAAPDPTPPAPHAPPEDIWTKETGWKSVDEAKAAKARLEELEKAPKVTEPIKFANEESEKLFNAWKEGKEDDVFNYFQTKKQMERIERLDVSKPKDAAEIIKLDLQYKNKDLTQDDIDYLFDKRYSTPDKPEQSLDQSDDEYAKELARWEKQVKTIEKGMVVDAKLAKPDLAKLKTEIVLPDIPKVAQADPEPTQEELAVMEKARTNFLQSLESGYVTFKGYSIKAKDEEVELPISYEVTDQERKSYKESLQGFDAQEYLQARWFDFDSKTGTVTPKVQEMMADKYLLENRDKIFQKIANEAAQKMKSHMIKLRHNIDLGGSSNNTSSQQPAKTGRDVEVSYLWKNG